MIQRFQVLMVSDNSANGVKQGGCMSPTLFSIYLNKLLVILRKSNVGCH